MIQVMEQGLPAGGKKKKVLALGLTAAFVLVAGLSLLSITARAAHASTFTVTNTADSGVGSLRKAIEDANATAASDTIRFNIPGAGPHKIEPSSALEINAPVVIDGYSQPGSKPNALATGNDALLKIELSGASAGANASGLKIKASNSTIKGLAINSWDGSGIEISNPTSTANKVHGNYIGTDASGTTQNVGNSTRGVYIDNAPNNTIGGTVSGARNLISGNDTSGVWIQGTGATGNKIQGNRIGTDASGTAVLGNPSGVFIYGALDNMVGGTKAEARNLISGNSVGVEIYGADAEGNRVQGNRIGTDPSGTADLGNSQEGVFIFFGASNNTIGGTVTGARNIISGNDGYGVWIYGPGAKGNKVQGNFIGTDASGTADLGNSLDGVYIDNATDNTVGGTVSGARNLISGNDGSGVHIGSGAASNRILSNSIHANNGLGIDLDPDGVTSNDDKDPDTGANNQQNFPVLSSAKPTKVIGTLNSTPGKTFTVQLFSNPSGSDEGKKLVGQKTDVTTDAISGDASFTITLTSKVNSESEITATATDKAAGDTSEFSAPQKVQ